jgi:Na+(H+)/acetate symporter ActP
MKLFLSLISLIVLIFFFFWGGMNQISYNQTKSQHTLSSQKNWKNRATHSSYKQHQSQQHAEQADIPH